MHQSFFVARTTIEPVQKWSVANNRISCFQVRNEVRCRPGREASLAPSCDGTWEFSEENLLHWRKYMWHCWDFSAPPAVIRLPGIVASLPSSLRPWLLYKTLNRKNVTVFLRSIAIGYLFDILFLISHLFAVNLELS